MKKSAAYIRDKVMEVISGRGAQGATSLEIAEQLNYAYETVQPRTSELKKMGLITDSGIRRASRAEGKRAIAWVKV